MTLLLFQCLFYVSSQLYECSCNGNCSLTLETMRNLNTSSLRMKMAHAKMEHAGLDIAQITVKLITQTTGVKLDGTNVLFLCLLYFISAMSYHQGSVIFVNVTDCLPCYICCILGAKKIKVIAALSPCRFPPFYCALPETENSCLLQQLIDM